MSRKGPSSRAGARRNLDPYSMRGSSHSVTQITRDVGLEEERLRAIRVSGRRNVPKVEATRLLFGQILQLSPEGAKKSALSVSNGFTSSRQ